MRRAFDGHGAADVDVGLVDLAPGEAECVSRSKLGAARSSASMPSSSAQEVVAERPAVEGELDVEGARQRFLHLLDRLGVKPLALSVAWLMCGRRPSVPGPRHRRRSRRSGFGVAEPRQRRRHGAVDDLEVAAAGELLELHQREVGLDAGGVAIHHQADGAGRRDDGHLGVAVAVGFAQLDHAIRRAWRARTGR